MPLTLPLSFFVKAFIETLVFQSQEVVISTRIRSSSIVKKRQFTHSRESDGQTYWYQMWWYSNQPGHSHPGRQKSRDPRWWKGCHSWQPLPPRQPDTSLFALRGHTAMSNSPTKVDDRIKWDTRLHLNNVAQEENEDWGLPTRIWSACSACHRDVVFLDVVSGTKSSPEGKEKNETRKSPAMLGDMGPRRNREQTGRLERDLERRMH